MQLKYFTGTNLETFEFWKYGEGGTEKGVCMYSNTNNNNNNKNNNNLIIIIAFIILYMVKNKRTAAAQRMWPCVTKQSKNLRVVDF